MIRFGPDYPSAIASQALMRYVQDMADEPENLTLRLLQEMREDIRAMRSRFDAVDEKLKELGQRLNGISVLLTSVAGITHDHEERITALESR